MDPLREHWSKGQSFNHRLVLSAANDSQGSLLVP